MITPTLPFQTLPLPSVGALLGGSYGFLQRSDYSKSFFVAIGASLALSGNAPSLPGILQAPRSYIDFGASPIEQVITSLGAYLGERFPDGHYHKDSITIYMSTDPAVQALRWGKNWSQRFHAFGGRIMASPSLGRVEKRNFLMSLERLTEQYQRERKIWEWLPMHLGSFLERRNPERENALSLITQHFWGNRNGAEINQIDPAYFDTTTFPPQFRLSMADVLEIGRYFATDALQFRAPQTSVRISDSPQLDMSLTNIQSEETLASVTGWLMEYAVHHELLPHAAPAISIVPRFLQDNEIYEMTFNIRGFRISDRSLESHFLLERTVATLEQQQWSALFMRSQEDGVDLRFFIPFSGVREYSAPGFRQYQPQPT